MLIQFLNKINPFNYNENPIGAFKTELIFHIMILIVLSYISGGTFILNKINIEYPAVPFWCVFSLGIFSWMRVSYLISKIKGN